MWEHSISTQVCRRFREHAGVLAEKLCRTVLLLCREAVGKVFYQALDVLFVCSVWFLIAWRYFDSYGWLSHSEHVFCGFTHMPSLLPFNTLTYADLPPDVRRARASSIPFPKLIDSTSQSTDFTGSVFQTDFTGMSRSLIGGSSTVLDK